MRSSRNETWEVTEKTEDTSLFAFDMRARSLPWLPRSLYLTYKRCARLYAHTRRTRKRELKVQVVKARDKQLALCAVAKSREIAS